MADVPRGAGRPARLLRQSASSLTGWSAGASKDDINKSGVILSGLTAGAQVYHQITTEKLGTRRIDGAGA